MKTKNGTTITFEYEDGFINRALIIMTFPCGNQQYFRLVPDGKENW
jgi:hypothetical protein